MRQAEGKLRALADNVTRRLLSVYGNSGHLTVAASSFKVDTFGDGPCYRIASVWNPRGALQIWLDYSKFWGGVDRRVWHGVYSNRRMIGRVTDIGHFRGKIRKTGKHTQVIRGFERFVPRLVSRELNIAVEEHYGHDQVFVGVYTDTKIDHSSMQKRIVKWTNDWLPKLIEDADASEDREWRRHCVVERVNRSTMLATLARRNSNFFCEVCKFRFQDTCGDLGEGFLEARHLLPVGQSEKRTWNTQANSLAAICSNCHRMLHSLLRRKPVISIRQARNRVMELRKIVQQHQKRRLAAT